MNLWVTWISILAIVPMGATQKILVMPLVVGMNSRLFNMVKMSDMLADVGYDVTILTSPSSKPFIKTTKVDVYEVNSVSYTMKIK